MSKKILLRLDEEIVAELDHQLNNARYWKTSRSEIIRFILYEYLKNHPKKTKAFGKFVVSSGYRYRDPWN